MLAAKASSGLKRSSRYAWPRAGNIAGRRHILVFEHPCCPGLRSVDRLPVFRGDLHQNPARSWYVFGEPMPVCIRCASIYFAFTASLWIGIRPHVRWLRISLLLMFFEFAVARFVIDAALLRSVSAVLI